MFILCCRDSEKDNVGLGNASQGGSQRPPISVQPYPRVANFSEVAAQTTEYGNSEFYEQSRFKSFSAERNSHSNPISHQQLPRLEDYNNSEDLNQLTIKEIKALLFLNRVDFKGCVEKGELLEKVNRLWDDKHQQKDIPEDTPSNELCKICMAATLDCVLLECGHIASCIECGKVLAECPICREYVVRVVRTFKA